MPGLLRCTCGDYTRVFVFITHEAAGALGTRHSLRPLNFRGESFLHHSDASRHEIAESYLKFERHHDEERPSRLGRTPLRPHDLRMAARLARNGVAWWGRKDSNLRSHEAADLQSAPFATRDTPPLNSIATAAEMADTRPWMTRKPEGPSRGLPVGRVYGRSRTAKSTNGSCHYRRLRAQIAIIRNP
jgi:hypothetical protein